MEMQVEIPGVEKERIEEITVAARDYVKARDTRVAASRPEIEKKQSLIALMKKHELTSYADDGLTVELTVAKEKIKVKLDDDDEAEEE
jgi:hypothetical protein